MLKTLSIKNFGVVKEMVIDFDRGLNIITGETGAGKSLILGALKLLGGDRFNREVIRDKNIPVRVEGVFEGDFSFLDSELREEFDIGDEIIVKRFFEDSGKSRTTINGSNASTVQLKSIFSELLEIHGQYENQKLLNPKNHLSYVDSYVKSLDLENYIKKFNYFQQIKKRVKELESEIESVMKNREIIEFQINEIEYLNINPSEDNKLNEKIKFLSNIEKIAENRSLALSNLKYNEINAYDLLTDSLKAIETAGKFSEKFSDISAKLNNTIYILNDIIRELEEFGDEEFDSNYLNMLNERRYRLDNLIKKYGKNLEEILSFHKVLKDKLNSLKTDEDELKKLKEEVSKVEGELKIIGEKINTQRGKAAETICSKVEKILTDLELKHAVMKTKNDFLDSLDKNCGFSMEFLISTNPGFAPGPLSKIASGGEISRIMLALKEIFSESDSVETLVFDEIDTGISGVTAKKVANKLNILSKKKQLIVITHLPVVAAMADRHLHISKKHEDNSTETCLRYLNDDERKRVIAMMLSGSLTDSSLKQAEEMIKEA